MNNLIETIDGIMHDKRCNLIFLWIIIQFSVANSYAQTDIMAEIGNKRAAVRTHLLVTPQPPILAQKTLPLNTGRAFAFTPMSKLDTKEKLQDSLIAMRRRYGKFLQNLAPELVSKRIIQSIDAFSWRKETAEDKKNFAAVIEGKGNWEMVSIPHYGPPLGLAVTYYRTTFNVTAEMLARGSVFLKFNGVDYKAEVFVNGTYYGAHEGIFAPFEFNVSEQVKEGENNLLVKVYNDYVMQGSEGDDGRKLNGDKLYAATGSGYNDPEIGWHHCPPGMGIYQAVTVEGRGTLQLNDVFVRPIKDTDTAEVWLEVLNTELEPKSIKIKHAVYGQNFLQRIYENAVYEPRTVQIPGVGDLAKSTDNEVSVLEMGRGLNFLKFKIVIHAAKRWNNETPWLYQLQLMLLDENGKVVDSQKQQFGMRSFRMDTLNSPKGMMFLNDRPIRLRGANTMGAFQQSVLKKDWHQLIDDILLAKLTNMNFIRMTQMPVQKEIYDYFDKLGLMTQTDLPLFGVLRKNKWVEAVRQTEEMEKLVRSHPCNIMVSYINERFPNAEGKPQRNLDSYDDFEKFFKAADQAVLMNNPDRVIKAGDGDYDPPSPGLPDNHCYNGWYNGHGLGLGEMHKGYWLDVKPGWYYACGEFGSEGLEAVSTMRKYYPKSWLPQSKSEETAWTPDKIPRSQTFDFHYMWFNSQHTLSNWVNASQAHQALITRLTTEAFRRDSRMVSFAIHLFIDAFPSGWMKSIMDVDRQPKKAWFEYRDALTPLAVQLRTDRSQFFSGDSISIEAWIVNDMNQKPKGSVLKYQLELGGVIKNSGEIPALIPLNSSQFQGFINAAVPNVKERTDLVVRLGLFDEKGTALHQANLDLIIFPKSPIDQKLIWIAGSQHELIRMAEELNLKITRSISRAAVILLNNYDTYVQNRNAIDLAVKSGKIAVILELPEGHYDFAGNKAEVKKNRMGSYYFVSPETGHKMMKNFDAFDFRFWVDGRTKRISPILDAMLNAPDWKTILKTGDLTDWGGDAQAASEKKVGKGIFRICQVKLPGRIVENPVARLFALKLLEE